MGDKTLEMTMLFDFFGDLLTDKQKEYFDLYYNDDLSLAEIAESQDITRQGVRESIKRAEAQMMEMEDRLHLAARFRDMRDGLEAIREAAQDIQMLNDRTRYSREIDERSKRIVQLADELRER